MRIDLCSRGLDRPAASPRMYCSVRGEQRGKSGSGDRHPARERCASSRLRKRRGWGVCGRGDRSGGFREGDLTRGAGECSLAILVGFLFFFRSSFHTLGPSCSIGALVTDLSLAGRRDLGLG